MRVDAFDFELPEDRIALRPARPRDSARLLVVDPRKSDLSDRLIADLPALLAPGDALVLNDARVIPAALQGMRHRGDDTANISFTLIAPLGASQWSTLARPAKRLKAGDRVTFGHGGDVCLMGTLSATVEERGEGGEVILAFDFQGAALDEAIASVGLMPLPPYIASRRPADERDEDDYQTIYARHTGAVAAPTAGLHFTDELFASLDAIGVTRHFVTLFVGAGTFLPIRVDDTKDHRMHSERGAVSEETAAALNAVRAKGGRIVSVGTTALRLLESAATPERQIQAFEGKTDIFITPGYRFKGIDRLITNFHLPKSTLFMLVSAFSGLDCMKQAYAHAVANDYRFYSYGDACLLSPAEEAI